MNQEPADRGQSMSDPNMAGRSTSAPAGHATDRVTSQAEIELLRRRFEFLEKVSEVLASSLDFKTTLTNVARLAVPHIADWCAIDICAGEYCDDPSRLERLVVTHIDPAKIDLAYELEKRYPTDTSAPTGIYHVARTGASEYYREIPEEMLLASAIDAEHLEIIRGLGLRSAMSVPLSARGRTLGVLSMVSAESGRIFNEDDLHVAQDLACRAAMAIDNSNLYKRAKLAETALRERLDFTNAMMTSIGEAIYALDREGKLTYMNPAAEQLLGWKQRELNGKTIHEVIHYLRPDGSPFPAEECPLLRVTRFGDAYRADDDVFIKKNGTMLPVAYTSAPILSNGIISGAILAFHDISEQKRQEQELRAQREWFHTTLASIGDAVIATDLRGTVTFLNRIAERLIGSSSDDAIGRPIGEIFSIVEYGTGRATENPVDAVLKGTSGTSSGRSLMLIAGDGSETPIDTTAAPIRNERGEVHGAILVFHDITERKRAEDALRRSNEKRNRLLESIGDAFIGLDRDWRFTYANRRAQELFAPMQKERADLTGMVLWAEFPDLIWTDMYQKYHAALRDQQPVDFEVNIQQIGGWFAIHAYPSLDGLSIFLKDINDRKGIDVERLRLLDDAQDAERRLHNLVDVIGGVSWVADPETFNYLSVDGNADELLGYDVEEWLRPDFWTRRLFPDDRDASVTTRRRSVQSGVDHRATYRLVAADGGIVKISEVVYVSVGADGRPTKLSGVMYGVPEERSRGPVNGGEHKVTIESSGIESSGIEASSAEMIDVGTIGADEPGLLRSVDAGAEMPGMDLSGGEVPGMDVPGVDAPGIDAQSSRLGSDVAEA